MIDILPAIKGVLFSILQRSKISDIPEDLQHVQFDKLVDNNGLVNMAEVDPVKDIAVLQYTGGTTGLPKGAMLTHANVLANAQQIKYWMPSIDGGDESVLGVIPLFHSFAMTTVMNLSLISGSQMYLLPRFDLKQVLETLSKNKVTSKTDNKDEKSLKENIKIDPDTNTRKVNVDENGDEDEKIR